MKTPSKSKAEWTKITDVRDPAFGHATHEHEYTQDRPNGFHQVWVDPQNDRWLAKEETEIIARMEAMQSCFNPFPSLLQSAENERRLQLADRADWVRDGDPPAFAGESEAEYNQRMDEREQDRYDMQEAE